MTEKATGTIKRGLAQMLKGGVVAVRAPRLAY